MTIIIIIWSACQYKRVVDYNIVKVDWRWGSGKSSFSMGPSTTEQQLKQKDNEWIDESQRQKRPRSEWDWSWRNERDRGPQVTRPHYNAIFSSSDDVLIEYFNSCSAAPASSALSYKVNSLLHSKRTKDSFYAHYVESIALESTRPTRALSAGLIFPTQTDHVWTVALAPSTMQWKEWSRTEKIRDYSLSHSLSL